MAKHKIESNKKTTLAEYVTVAIAEDMELAEEYKGVLDSSDIPAVLRTQRGGEAEILGVAVMVPEDSCEPAIAIIESQQAFDDFLDIAFNEDDDKNCLDYFEEEENLEYDDF